MANGLDGTVSRINPDPSVDREVQKIHVGNGPVGVAWGAGNVWVTNSVDGTVSVIDPESGDVLRTLPAVQGATAIVVAFGRVWVVSPSEGVVVSLDPKSGAIVDRISVGVDPVAVAAGDGAIWVANRDDGTVSVITPKSPAHVTGVDPVGHGPISVAVVKGGVWVANGADGTLMRIDAASGSVVQVVTIENPPQALAAAPQGTYAAVRSSRLEHRGGTLRALELAPDFLDPALAYSEQAWAPLSITNDGLVGFRRVGGIEGVQLVPDLADALPAPSDSGRAYAFRLRSGVRYSSGKLVQPADFRRAIERLFEAAKPRSSGRGYFTGIVGAAACRAGRRCSLSRGIAADAAARTVTFHLTAPDGDFLSKLALPFADAVPAGTAAPSAAGDHALPATGPYMIVGYRRNKSLRLKRNPHFQEWSADAQPLGYPDRLVFTFPRDIPGSSIRAVRSVLHGDADVVLDADVPPLSKQQLTALAARYPSQLRLSTRPATNFFFLNTRVTPFDDVRVRRAVNEALDRSAYVASLGPGYTPTCQILPPNYPGYRRTCPYGSGGTDGLERARRLVRAAGKGGTRVAVWMPSPTVSQGGFIVSLLNSIGLRAHLKSIPPGVGPNSYFARILDPRRRAQMGFDGWIADFPSDAGFLPPIFSCASFSENPKANGDPSEFCDPAVDRLFARAEAAQAQNPAAAPALWQAAERAILAQAPLVPTHNPQSAAFVAKRVGNFQYHPQWGVQLDQLWLK